ncbi:MAG: PLDc N-terminal domain-containing protein [Firmicutes bacterium]|nr:PLDc N-terminal domain-containing protein [Bacillota bacterium]
MRKIFKAIYSNKLLAILMLIFQILILISGFIWLSDYSKYFFGASTLLSALLVIYEINNSKDSPEFKMTWLVLVGVVPIFGALLYIYLRFGVLSKGISLHHKDVHNKVAKNILREANSINRIKNIDPELYGLANYLMKADGASPYSDAEVKYYELGEKMYADIKAEMESAEKFIFMEFFIVNCSSSMWKELFDILCRKAREGVEVRFMYDGMGSLATTPTHLALIFE